MVILPRQEPGASLATSKLEPFGQPLHLQTGVWSFFRLNNSPKKRGKRMTMNFEVISTKNAPLAIGPYSQAVKFDNFVFVSGQLGIDPNTGALVNGNMKSKQSRH